MTKRPFPAAFEYLAGPIVIIRTSTTPRSGRKGVNEKPIGTGPYRVTEHAVGKYIRTERNPDYFKDSPKSQPRSKRPSSASC